MAAFSQSECFLNVVQEFLVSTTIHKAKNLPAFNADTYVRVSLDNISKSTKVFQNSENPYYNEYFVFELSCTLAELLRLTVLYEVKRKTCCKVHVTLGELLIDLHTVWNQPHKSFFKKWGKLESSIGSQDEARGHLQIDLAIISHNQPLVPAVMSGGDCDDIDTNLLQGLDVSICNIKYRISFYKGAFIKKSDFILQVSFAGMNGKTSVRKGSAYPEWNEELQFNWIYPSLAQTFLVQVMTTEHLCWKCVAKSEIYFDEISFDVPSLGPTYIHFYDFNTYVGRVLLEIKAEKVSTAAESINRICTMMPTQPIAENMWWATETFIVEFLMWQGEFIHANLSNLKIIMRLGENTSDTVECFPNSYEGNSAPIKNFSQKPPFKAIHIKCVLPDNRLKYESDHFMSSLAAQMKSKMENFKLFQLKYPNNEPMNCKCLKAIVVSILEKVDGPKSSSRLQFNGLKKQTVWDENRLSYLKEFFVRFSKSLKDLRQDLKTLSDGELTCNKVFEELEKLRGQLQALIQTRIQDEWPDLQLLMCLGKGAGKEFSICQLNARHFVYSQRNECNGNWTAVPRNFVFKDINCTHTCKICGCVRGFVYGWLRIATEAEQGDFLVSPDWEQKERFYYRPKEESSAFLCRLYIHQAKIQPGADKSGLCDAVLKAYFGNQIQATSTVFKSLSPVWNECITFPVRKMPGAVEWYENNPPLLPVQLYDVDRSKDNDYLGCGLVELSVQNAANRKQPLTPIEADAPIAYEDSGKAVEKMRSKSGVFNFRKFVKTRVALNKLNELKSLSPPILKWVMLANVGSTRVEVLMSGELLQVNEGEYPDSLKAVLAKALPKEIQPVMRRYLLEVTFAGLRNCQKLSSSSLGRYKIHVMMGELLLKSGVSGTRLKNSITFLENYASGILNLPEQFEYWPPIIAAQIDCPGRNREVTLGATLISNPSKYLQKLESPCDLMENNESTVISVGEADEENVPLLPPKSILKKSCFTQFKERILKLVPRSSSKGNKTRHSYTDDSEFNWWTKFYNSMHLQEQSLESSSKHTLVIYTSELEKESQFDYLSDWAEAFQLVHGVKMKKNKPPVQEFYATLKMSINLVPCSCNTASSVTLSSVASKVSAKLQSLNSISEQTKVIVRVYLVQGIQFRSRDNQSQSDSYVKIQLGSNVISDRAHYVRNQSSPVFGKSFQMEAVIPREHILQISVYDRGVHDEIIGSTFIDLEDRLRSKHRATVGIANEFNRSGYNMWRDALTPYEILSDLCKKYHLNPPLFGPDTVEIEGVKFGDSTTIAIGEDKQEQLSLSVLKNIQAVPSIGYRLVPEHVETRSLYRTDRPGIEQGKLQLWVEIFREGKLPPPIDITPAPARIYELRLIVYNCSEVMNNETNVFGTKMSDIYIKAWCSDSEQVQTTDVHYRSLSGEGNFNWRMIFPIKYSNVEDMIVIKQRGGLLDEYEVKHPPVVYLQIWDNDSFSSDDFMGAMEICLSNFSEPFESSKACTDQLKNKRKSINLFREKTVRGWFPCGGNLKKGQDILAGKLELELEILTESEAATNPAGLGRNPPNALSAPERPDTSFNPFTSPLKSFHHILKPMLKKCLCYFVLAAIIIAVVLFFVEDLPHTIMEFFHN